MKKRLLSLLLAHLLLLSLCPAALAGEDVRETDFFTDQPHGDVDFSDMEYRTIDPAPILEEIEAVRALTGRASNEKAVSSRLEGLSDQLQELLTMQTLATIRTYQDVTDQEAAEELRHTSEACVTVSDALAVLARDTLNSPPCGGFLQELLGGAEAAFLLDYEALTDAQISQSSQELLLENQYLQASHETYTAEYGGREWGEEAARAALAAGQLSQDAYTEVSRSIARAQNQALGEIYLELAELRQQIARSYGYDSYADYAYDAIYQRDYTPGEIQDFHSAVREYIVPVCDALLTLYHAGAGGPAYARDYSGDAALDLIEPWLGGMSSELAESFGYMRAHGLYDTAASDVKASGGFTTLLDSYGAPFFFNCPNGSLYDFTTAVHEFGHYNSYYWQPAGLGGKSIDLAEVDSQGMELLFAHYYPEIFGEDAQAVLDYQLANLTSAIVQGSLQDELQQYVYSQEELTLSGINREYRRLCAEYGLIDRDSPSQEIYSWVQIPHTFTSPCYYISYAVSAAGAFSFWLDAQEDFLSAVDSYLEFAAMPAGLGFQTTFALLELGDPLDPAYLEDLAGALWEKLDLEERLEALTVDIAFTDVYEDSWFTPYVLALASAGLVQGCEDGSFRPEADATRDMFYQLLTGKPAPDRGGEAITRLDCARVLAEHLELSSDGTSPFTDVDDPAVTALAGLGVMDGYDGGVFRPGATLTRAELCVVIYRAALAFTSSRLAEMLAG